MGSISSGIMEAVKLLMPSAHCTPSSSSISSSILVLSLPGMLLSIISMWMFDILNSSDSFLLAMALSSVSGRPLSML